MSHVTLFSPSAEVGAKSQNLTRGASLALIRISDGEFCVVGADSLAVPNSRVELCDRYFDECYIWCGI